MEIEVNTEAVTLKRKCCVCSIDISNRRIGTLTCSTSCRVKKCRKETKVKTKKRCKGCEKIFTTVLPLKLYCTPKCKRKSYYHKAQKKSNSNLKEKLNALYRFGLVGCKQPPKGGRITIKVGFEKIQMFCTDLGGQIAKTPQQLYESFSIRELHRLCIWFNVNPCVSGSKIKTLQSILQSETYSIIETCINEIWAFHHAPPTTPPITPLSSPDLPQYQTEREKTPLILTYEDGLIAYKFFECSEKKQLLSIINQYRETYSQP